MTERQEEEFDIRQELVREILRADRSVIKEYARIIGWHALKEMEQPLSERIEEEVSKAVEKAIGKQRVKDGVDFVSERLKELFEEALEVYFKPIQDDFERIAESYRKDVDEADWWKGTDNDDE